MDRLLHRHWTEYERRRLRTGVHLFDQLPGLLVYAPLLNKVLPALMPSTNCDRLNDAGSVAHKHRAVGWAIPFPSQHTDSRIAVDKDLGQKPDRDRIHEAQGNDSGSQYWRGALKHASHCNIS